MARTNVFVYIHFMLQPFVRFCFFLFLCCSLTACGGGQGDHVLRLDPGVDSTEPSPLIINDPAGAIPAPELPPDLQQTVGEQPGASQEEEQRNAPTGVSDANSATPSPQNEGGRKTPRLRYSLDVLSPDAPELVPAFTKASLLARMADSPPSSVMGLEQRLRSDMPTAQDVLHAYGYYAGNAHGKVRKKRRDENDEQADARKNTVPNMYVATVSFDPGPQYSIGATRVTVSKPERMQPRDLSQKHRSPAKTLADVGLPDGSPALADAVLNAVSAVRENFRDRGYPFAKVANTRYVVDHETRVLEADVAVDSGPLVYMGDIEIQDESTVKKSYLEALRPWTPGRPWNQSLVEKFRDSLRQSGLFASAEISPAEEDDAQDRRAVVAKLEPAPARTIGGALKYDTDFGPGIQAYWENRNVTGRGDRLRIEAPLWADLQELVASYRLPFFLRKDQDFIAGAAVRSEKTDAYDLESATASVGLERRLSRRWTGSLSVMAEGGKLKDPDESSTQYYMTGLPGSLAYNGANSLLDATKGVRAQVSLAPYVGEYNDPFSVLRTRLEAQAFVPLIGQDSLVMAFRGMYGLLTGADAPEVPASLRFYVGGGGSVRGYEYQSLGPRNTSRDPLGGASAMEFSTEARMKFNETWGLVAFIDGGMAYTDQTPDFSEELQWGAGVGVRLYTAIGPVRFDIATPLNPRKKDSDVQMYFSIGQSF